MAMEVKVESSILLKPSSHSSPPTIPEIPLSVFDKVSYDNHMATLYAFRPPAPPVSTIRDGLGVALSEYREWAGRLRRDDYGSPVAIVLNDEGVRFVEASVDSTLDELLRVVPSPSLLSLHPQLNGVEELLQVQLTRFSCGSVVIGFTTHHYVADAHAVSDFLVAWGRTARGLLMEPLPEHDRGFFLPRDPPQIEFEHRGVEYEKKVQHDFDGVLDKNVVVQKVHFSMDFISKLKCRASADAAKPCSTFVSLLAHLWRAMTKARGLTDHDATTEIRVSVDGRWRLTPRVPDEFFGNLVLWAFPRITVKELMSKPLSFAAELIKKDILKVDDDYFKSFIDFASSGAVEREGLVPTADMGLPSLCPNLEVDSWVRFPFYKLDFGGGSPCCFMPSYFTMEGLIFILPSADGDGSVDAFVPLFQESVDAFKQACYVLE